MYRTIMTIYNLDNISIYFDIIIFIYHGYIDKEFP
jgi:hypothetical protein